MSKSLADVRREEQIKYYPDGLPKAADFITGNKVKIITPYEDGYFFFGETGTVARSENKYLGINVVFDTPRHFEDGYIQNDFNFEPRDLVVIGRRHCPKCGAEI